MIVLLSYIPIRNTNTSPLYSWKSHIYIEIILSSAEFIQDMKSKLD